MFVHPQRIIGHLRGNAVAYVALFAALGGTSYAATSLKPGSVTSTALAPSAVTHSKLAPAAVNQRNIIKRSLTADVFTKATLKSFAGSPGANGTAGATGPAGANGNGSVVLKTQGTGSVSAPHGAATAIPLNTGSWTQGASELNLIAGAVTLKTPAKCTGSFGNSIVVSVDGTPTTVGIVPTAAPAGTTLTIPIAVGELMEPGNSVNHQITAQLANTCQQDGEDFAVTGAKFDVLSFH